MARNVRDTAFTFMFSKEEYMSQLYNYLTGKRICPTEIRSVKLENKLTKSRLYNDVAYITNDNHLLVMIEHQSSLNRNMLFRMMEYYSELVSTFVIKGEGQNKYGTKEMQIPKAEFHVVYNGKGKMEKELKLDLGDIQLRGSVTNIHFGNLTHRDPTHALVAYAKLTELIDEIQMDINDAIDQLLAEGYLVEFFGRKEIRDMFAEIFSYDQELIDKGVEKGIEKGIAKGREEGRIEIAKKMIQRGDEVEGIAELTLLSIAEIENLKKELAVEQ